MLTPAVAAELQALLDGSYAANDWQLVHTLAPDADPALSHGMPPRVTASEVPAALLGLAAQRGHTALVNRLVGLSEAIRTTPKAYAKPSAPEKKSPDEVEKARKAALTTLLGTTFEAALVAGDRATSVLP
jgi:hypothetical protein